MYVFYYHKYPHPFCTSFDRSSNKNVLDIQKNFLEGMPFYLRIFYKELGYFSLSTALSNAFNYLCDVTIPSI